MPVKLWSGLPGAGKTAAMVAAILDFKREHPNRPVFAININGLHDSVAQKLTLDQLRCWWELPPEALICIDECQEPDYMPQDQGKPTEWVKRISKVRHEGMDFWLCTQHPNLMSSYVRRLVDQHVHFVRKFNTGVAAKFTWPRCMENCEKESAQKVAVSGFATLPKEVFELYKSSNAHNMRRRIPLKAYVLPIAVVVAVAALVAVPVVLHRMHSQTVAAVDPKANGVTAAVADPAKADQILRHSDYAKWLRPRVPGVPWTAPAFDELQVRAVPKIYCVAVDDGRCSCMTEQGTRYVVPVKQCRAVVEDGLYNPFDGGVQEAQSEDKEKRRQSVEPQARTAGASLAESGGTDAGGKDRATAFNYVPPTMGKWDPTPLPSGTGM